MSGDTERAHVGQNQLADMADTADMAASQKAGKIAAHPSLPKQLADLAKRSLKTDHNQPPGGTP